MKPGRNRPKPIEATAKPRVIPYIDSTRPVSRVPAAATSSPQKTSRRGLSDRKGIRPHWAIRVAPGAGHQHDGDRLLRLRERDSRAVDDEESDDSEQGGVAVAADDPDDVPGQNPRIAPAQPFDAVAAALAAADGDPAHRRIVDHLARARPSSACRREGAARPGRARRPRSRRRRSTGPKGRAARR